MDGRSTRPCAASCWTRSCGSSPLSPVADAYAKGRYKDAAKIFDELIEAERFPEFLTIPAYERLIGEGA